MAVQRNPPKCDVVILTFLSIEYTAVRTHLQNIEEVVHPQGTIYERGTCFGKERSLVVAIAQTDMGSTNAAIETERAIRFFHPELLFFVGIAGGLKEVQVGDVVVASKVYKYESGKVSQRFEPVPEIWRPSYALEQIATAEAAKRDWLTRLDEKNLNPEPHVFIGATAAGEQVISSKESVIYKLLRANYGDALAVEMEGHGFLGAVQNYSTISAMIIRGISDLIDQKAKIDTSDSQKLAAYHAAAFTFEVLAKFDFSEDLGNKDTRNFGRELGKLRRHTSLSQSDLATATDESPKTIARWERGDSMPRQGSLKKLIELFLLRDSFTKGKEQEEAKRLWDLVITHESFDLKWFWELLKKKSTSSPITLFYSYAREDEPSCVELEKHLRILQQQGFITEWHHRRIAPGTDWSKEIDTHLIRASVILLLISSDFLASDYSYSVEMARSLERHKANEARVIPIILRPTDWFDTPFAHLQALPRNAIPVTTWTNREEAFLEIFTGIRYACEELSTAEFIESESGFPRQPPRFYQLYEVFLKSGVPKVTFVEREDFELLKLSLAQPGRGVVIEGPSGIGKTTAVEKAVEELLSQ
jgi:nucleoside phosphorylase/transcriptional regulator with XRE-family HTH domain